MKNIRCAAALCAVLLFLCAALYGCGGTSENTGTTTPAQPVRETLNSWPQNEYTAALPAPQYGTPDYALIGPADTQYAVFLTDVTREQGDAYVDALVASGFALTEQTANDASAGVLLEKDGVLVTVAAGDGVLGIRIVLPQT